MKTIIISIFSFLMLASSLAFAQKSMDDFQVQVDGLGCPFCAYGLEKKFKEFKGIKGVQIDIETGDFSFQYPSEKSLSLTAVVQQVEKAGYTPMKTVITRANGLVETDAPLAAVDQGVAGVVSKKMFVAGNCEMCEARILKATSRLQGVAAAAWDAKTKMLDISYDAAALDLASISKAIAAAGHDTKDHKASENTYDGLPMCCKYERIEDK
jgi:mercuric ion binding protein